MLFKIFNPFFGRISKMNVTLRTTVVRVIQLSIYQIVIFAKNMTETYYFSPSPFTKNTDTS